MDDGLEASRRRARRNVVLTAAIAGLGGPLFGYDTGVIAGAPLPRRRANPRPAIRSGAPSVGGG
jgi:hypothetical protein